MLGGFVRVRGEVLPGWCLGHAVRSWPWAPRPVLVADLVGWSALWLAWWGGWLGGEAGLVGWLAWWGGWLGGVVGLVGGRLLFLSLLV